MPHKHTRRGKDLSTFDLEPSQIAKPLPVDTISKKKEATTIVGNSTAQRGAKRKRGGTVSDEVPRAFKRLMAFAEGKRFKSGLDDGVALKRKKKATKDVPLLASESPSSVPEVPTIKPGERLSEFSARVDAALPLAGLINSSTKDGKDPLGLKVRRTRKEKKLHKLYAQWREEDKKVKEKREEELELAEERDLESGAMDPGHRVPDGGSTNHKKKKRGKGTKYLGETAEKEDDPWAELKKKRGEAKIGLHDVAKAPPDLKKIAGNNILVRGAAVEAGSIPKSAGSLRRREELQGVREDVLASYRKMMEMKRETRQHARVG